MSTGRVISTNRLQTMRVTLTVIACMSLYGCQSTGYIAPVPVTMQSMRLVASTPEECPIVYLTEPWVSPCAPGERVCSLPDLNQDGEVGINDLLDVLSLWGEPNCHVFKRGDINKDGTIDAGDMLIILGVWGDLYDVTTWNRCDC